MAYAVYDNGKLAVSANFPEAKDLKAWNKAVFDSFDEAISYAMKWLEVPETWGIFHFPDGKPGIFDYSGYGDFIEIREEP